MPSNFPGTLRRQRRARLDREPRANRPQPTTPISIVTATKSGSVLTMTFNQPVSLKGVPQYTVTGASVTPLSAVMTNPTTLQITFTGAVTAATAVNVPYEEASIRNVSGGFVKDSTFPVS